MKLKEHKQYSSDGKLLAHFYTNKDGKIQGKYTAYSSGGELVFIHYYKNNQIISKDEWLLNKIKKLIYK